VWRVGVFCLGIALPILSTVAAVPRCLTTDQPLPVLQTDDKTRICALIGVWDSVVSQPQRSVLSRDIANWLDDTVNAMRAAVQNLDSIGCAQLEPAVLADATERLLTQIKGKSLAEVMRHREVRLYQETSEKTSWKYLPVYHIETFDTVSDDPVVVREFVGKSWLWYQTRPDPVWRASVSQGVYRLHNVDRPRAVKYLHFRPKCGDLRDAALSLEVAIDGSYVTPMSGAGLLYRFNPATNHYYAYIVTPDGRLKFFRRDAKKYHTLYSEVVARANHDGFHKLAIVGNNTHLYLYIDGRLVRAIPERQLDGTEAGIIALSQGNFRFDNFAIYGRFAGVAPEPKRVTAP